MPGGKPAGCDHQFQPGFTHWGSFAEFVSIRRADLNLVALPETMAFDTAASLGCRFATSFRAVVDQGRTRAGQWVAVHGCGGVGLSAVMIAAAVGANVIGVDIADDKLALARDLGAVATVNANSVADVAEAVIELTGGGAHVSIDALGAPTTCFNSVSCLRKRGKHVQVGLLLGRSERAADSDGQSCRQRARTARQPRHAGASLRRDAGHGPVRQASAGAADRRTHQPRAVDRRADEMDTFQSVGVSVVTSF